MVGIRVNRGYGKGVGERLAAMENVAYVGYTTGSFDILIEVHLPDNEALYRFLNEDLDETRASPTRTRGTSCAPTPRTSSGRARMPAEEPLEGELRASPAARGGDRAGSTLDISTARLCSGH